MFNRTYPDLHKKIINFMQMLNCPADIFVYVSIDMMGVHAFAINDIQSFNKRIDLLHSYPCDYLLDFAIRDVKAKLAMDSQHSTPPKKLCLSAYEQSMIDMLAFLEGIE